MLMVCMEPSVGSNLTHTLMEYCEPLYILLLTLICGPSKLWVLLVVSKLWVPPWASAVLFATVAPAREDQPSTPPSSNVEVIPVLSCGPPGGGAISVMTTLSR